MGEPTVSTNGERISEQQWRERAERAERELAAARGLCACGHSRGAHYNELGDLSYCRKCNCYGWTP